MENEIKITEKSILIKVNQSYRADMPAYELYEYTRGRWKVDLKKAREVDYAFAVFQGIIKEVYKVVEWYPAGEILSLIIFKNNEQENAPDQFGGRSTFVGRLAEANLRERYIGKSVDQYFKKGMANPILYLNL